MPVVVTLHKRRRIFSATNQEVKFYALAYFFGSILGIFALEIESLPCPVHASQHGGLMIRPHGVNAHGGVDLRMPLAQVSPRWPSRENRLTVKAAFSKVTEANCKGRFFQVVLHQRLHETQRIE